MAIRSETKGKNFSGNSRSAARSARDFYQTPYSMTRHLIASEGFDDPILEPAAGGGAIVRVLQEAGHAVEYYDLAGGTDFLLEKRRYPSIITNPPFRRANEFIKKAVRIADKIAFLMPVDYLHGLERYREIYSMDCLRPYRIYVFIRKPMLSESIREDGKYGTGMMVYAWYVWDRLFCRKFPEVRWIDNNADVLRKETPATGCEEVLF